MVYTENGMYTAVRRRAPHPKLCSSQIGEFFLPHPVLRQQEKLLHFMSCCTLRFTPHNSHLSHNYLFFFVQIILKFFINHMLKFKYQPCHLKVKGMIRHCSCHHNPTVCACPRGLVLCSNTGPNAIHTHTRSVHYFNPALNIPNYQLLGLF
jgi:hypothetical protein